MTDTEQRFALSMRQADDDEPGLIRERDGTVWLVNPDGTRTQLGGENGGSLPEEWTVGGDAPYGGAAGVSIAYEDAIDVPFSLFTTQGGSNSGLDLLSGPDSGDSPYFLRCIDAEGNQLLGLDASNEIIELNPSRDNANQGGIVITDRTPSGLAADARLINARGHGTPRPYFALDNLARPIIATHTPPDDSALSPGEVALYFDPTDGAAKVMAKGKTLDGTVVSGELGSLS